MLNNRYLPLALCGIAFITWSFLVYYKYAHFGYNDWDLAFYTQACWQLLHGSQYTSVTGINYFGDHSYYLTFLSLPFFALAPHPLTLVFLKLIAFFVAANLFYKIINETLGRTTALILMVLYIFFPANIFSLLYEFNPESFAPPILFWMFMFFQRRQWGGFFIASIFLMMIKENMALIVCAFGLYGILTKNCPPKVAWFSVSLGAGVFYLLVVYAVPYFRHLPYHPFIVRYEYLGHSNGEILFNLFNHPQKVLHAIFSDMNGKYIKSLFGPLLLPVLISWQYLFLVSPVLLQHMLSDSPSEHSIYYHYGSTIAPFIFMALAGTLKLCSENFSPRIFKSILFLLVFTLISFLYCFLDPFVYKLNYHRDHLDAVRWDFVDAIPPQAGVIATFDFLTPLSLREYLYAFHKIYNESYQNPQEIKSSELNTGKSFVLPDQVRYALIDFKDPWLKQSLTFWPQATSQRIKMFLKTGHWKIIKSYGSIVLLRR